MNQTKQQLTAQEQLIKELERKRTIEAMSAAEGEQQSVAELKAKLAKKEGLVETLQE